MSELIDLVADLAIRCDDCGESGRPKEALLLGWDTVGLFCHDEEKSCYNYVLMRAA